MPSIIRKEYTRERTCPDCGRVDIIQKYCKAERCMPCANERNKAGLVAAAKARGERFRATWAKCETCGDPRSPETTRFCSAACKPKGERVDRTCKHCGQAFRVGRGTLEGPSNTSANFCSRPCYHDWQRRPYERKRQPDRRGWKAIQKRWKGRHPFCAWCGTRRGRIDVHHIAPWRLSKCNDDENLITLCRKDHAWVEHETRRLVKASGPDDWPNVVAVLAAILRYREKATEEKLRQLAEEITWQRRRSMPTRPNSEPSLTSCPTQEIPENTRRKPHPRWYEVFRNSAGLTQS